MITATELAELIEKLPSMGRVVAELNLGIRFEVQEVTRTLEGIPFWSQVGTESFATLEDAKGYLVKKVGINRYRIIEINEVWYPKVNIEVTFD